MFFKDFDKLDKSAKDIYSLAESSGNEMLNIYQNNEEEIIKKKINILEANKMMKLVKKKIKILNIIEIMLMVSLISIVVVFFRYVNVKLSNKRNTDISIRGEVFFKKKDELESEINKLKSLENDIDFKIKSILNINHKIDQFRNLFLDQISYKGMLTHQQIIQSTKNLISLKDINVILNEQVNSRQLEKIILNNNILYKSLKYNANIKRVVINS